MKMLDFRSSDIKGLKYMMDGPVLGLFCSVLGTFRQKNTQITVGRWLGISFPLLCPVEMMERTRSVWKDGGYQQSNALNFNIFVDK